MFVETAEICHKVRTDAVLPTLAPALTDNAMRCDVADRLLAPHDDSVKARFWDRVDVCAPEECWVWYGQKTGGGYGRFSVNGKTRPAHQVAWEIHNGQPFPEGKIGCHACDNPPCVNPHHINPGTHKSNMQECIERGRHTLLNRTHCIRGHEYTPENTRRKKGARECRICRNQYEKERWARKVPRKLRVADHIAAYMREHQIDCIKFGDRELVHAASPHIELTKTHPLDVMHAALNAMERAPDIFEKGLYEGKDNRAHARIVRGFRLKNLSPEAQVAEQRK